MDYKGVINFWFKDTTPKQWFVKDATFDEEIRSRFLQTHQRVMRGETKDWREHPEGRLAEIIVLDQFSRNMFRDTPQAFAGDALALTLAQEAVEASDDQKLSRSERQFLYMPYMHSENKVVHEKALVLFTSLGGENKKYELQHKEIIDRFGRYPHRNKILDRTSTPEELEFIATHKGF